MCLLIGVPCDDSTLSSDGDDEDIELIVQSLTRLSHALYCNLSNLFCSSNNGQRVE